MAASILKLLTGVVESFVGKKPPTEIAKNLGVEFPELRVALQQTITHTWRGKLTFVLGDPEFRPDLVPYYTHLARLEEQYGVLMNQRRRAEQICHDVRANSHGYSIPLLLKAEMFANRVESQCVRVLASIQKTELLLAKTEKNPPGQEEAQEASNAPHKTDATVAPSPEAPSPVVVQEASTESTSEPEVVGSAVRTEETNPPAAPAPDPQSPAPTFPDPEEFKLIILRHRHRIKNTPEKDRQQLIARLIEQHQMQKQGQADPNQNGKHAA